MNFATIFLLAAVLLLVFLQLGNAASCSSACPPPGNPVSTSTCTQTAVRYRSRRSWFRRRTVSYQATQTLCCPGYNLRNGRCYRPVNECASSPCRNGGTCVDQTIGFTCRCTAAYYGNVCQTRRIMPCSADCPAPANVQEMNHCTKTGIAYRSRRSWFRRRTVSYQTTVKACCPGFNLGSNNRCRRVAVVNPCAPNPCRNGGTCIRQGTIYQCNCRSGFIGQNCQSNAIANEKAWYTGSTNKCGISKYSNAGQLALPNANIVGGVNARTNEFPWQATLTRVSNGQLIFYCGAVIINRYWLLTASHCIDGFEQYSKKVLVGNHRLGQGDTTQRTHDILRAIKHPQFVGSSSDYDLGLLRTTTPMVFNANTRPVCPPENNGVYDHRKSVASGWGANRKDGPVSNTLQYTTLNITTAAYCRSRLGSLVTSRMICTWDNRGGTQRSHCSGDSGGPLTVKETSGHFRLVGIASWVRANGTLCDAGFPSGFARVTEFMSWINSVVPQNERT